MPTLRHPLVATSLPKLFLQGNPIPQLQQTACLNLLKLLPIVRRILPSKCLKKCTDSNMVTLITTVQ